MNIYTEIEKLQMVFTELLSEEFEAQGHTMTNKLINDIKYKVRFEFESIIIDGMMYPYGSILDRGIKPGKVPFSGTGKKGGVSLYIKALQKYAQLRMNIGSDREALGVAFAIAHTQRREGMPTYDSYRFSSTGKRMDWIEEALRKDRLTQAVTTLSFNVFSVDIDTFVKKWNVEMNRMN